MLVATLLLGCNLSPQDTATDDSGVDTAGQTTPTQETQNQVADNSNRFTGKLADLLQRQQNLTCTFSYADPEGNQSNGVIYISNDGDRLRGDFQLTNSEGTMESHMIQKNGFSYVWSSAFDQGYKTKIDADQNYQDDLPEDQSDSFDFNQEYEYSCQPWTIDATKFQEPADVDFIDLSAEFDQMIQSSQEVQTIKCQACDTLEGDNKTACLEAMGC